MAVQTVDAPRRAGLSEEQRALRRHRVSGSDVAAVAGLDPWRGPLDVYLDKKGLRDDQDTFHTERGTFLEPSIIRWYEHRTGWVVEPVGTIVHPERDWIAATPDGVVVIDGVRMRALECKAPRFSRHWGEPETDQVPEYYIGQTTLEAAVLGVGVADVAALLDGNLQVYRVPFNPRLFDALCDIAARFLRDHIEADVPPPVDGSAKAREWLLQRYPRAVGDMVEATEEALEWARLYDIASAEARAAEKKQDYYGNKLRSFLGDREGFEGHGTKATWKNNADRKVIDYKSIVAELKPPKDLIAKYTTEVPGPRVLRVTVKE